MERLQEWAASDKCLSVMGKRLFLLMMPHFLMMIYKFI